MDTIDSNQGTVSSLEALLLAVRGVLISPIVLPHLHSYNELVFATINTIASTRSVVIWDGNKYISIDGSELDPSHVSL